MNRRMFLRSSLATSAALASPEFLRAAMQAEDRAGKTHTTSYPSLKGPFRLPQSWYRQATKRFQQRLAEKDLDAAVVSDPNNVNYLTGSFAVTTERPLFLVIPAKGEPAILHPGLDRDLWETWWIEDREWYFDFPHHGAFNRVTWEAGAPVDLFGWMAEGLEKRGLAKGRIGFESRPADDDLETFNKTLPAAQADWKIVGPELLHMRWVKTEEELALARVALELHDRMLEFARNYILTHGTDATDFEVGHATQAYAAQELTRSLELDGRPHKGVGITLGFECRTGQATAYPHPNQFFYQKIAKGDAIQVAGWVKVGGHGGEGYRGMQIAGPGVGELHHKLWDVHTAMTLKQQELMKAGVNCNQVAEAVLALPRAAGLEKYIYHRPAHGEGSEGHQAPYLSLGDETVLEENMTFSNEPGLYNPEGGFGYNHSNLVRVTTDGGEQMNRTPVTKEWCWIKI